MNINSIGLPESEQNIRTARRYAKSKDLSLQKVRNKDLWNVKDLQSGAFIAKDIPFSEAYEIINQYDF